MKICVQIENKRQYLLDYHDTVARQFFFVAPHKMKNIKKMFISNDDFMIFTHFTAQNMGAYEMNASDGVA